MTCAKLWPDLIISLHVKTVAIFNHYHSKSRLWAHKQLVKWLLGHTITNSENMPNDQHPPLLPRQPFFFISGHCISKKKVTSLCGGQDLTCCTLYVSLKNAEFSYFTWLPKLELHSWSIFSLMDDEHPPMLLSCFVVVVSVYMTCTDVLTVSDILSVLFLFLFFL